MMDIKPIKTDADYRAALKEIDTLWLSPEDTPEGDRLEILVSLVELYEQKHFPMPQLDPIEHIIGNMDLNGRTQADLAKLLGSRSRASEVLNRKRPLTLEMIHKLHEEWKIPAEFLIRPYKLDAA